MSRHYSPIDVLTADPKRANNNKYGFEFDEVVFYNEIYANAETPEKELKLANTLIPSSGIYADNSKIVFLVGYAGCGKTVYISKFFFSNFKSNCSFNNIDFNKTANSGQDIVDILVNNFSIMMSEDLEVNHSCYEKFSMFVNDFESAITETIDSKGSITQVFVGDESFFSINYPGKVITKRMIHEKLKLICMNISNMGLGLSPAYHFLLTLNCLWRTYKYIESKKVIEDTSLLYLAFDNLDNIKDSETVHEFVARLITLKNKFDEFLHELYKSLSIQMSFQFIVSARMISFGKIRGYLGEVLADESDKVYGEAIFMSDYFKLDHIINNRVKFINSCIRYDVPLFNDEERNRATNIYELSKTEFAIKTLKKLYNFNYRKSIELINDICEYTNDINLSNCLKLENDGGGDNHNYHGASSYLLRLIFNYLQKDGFFNSFRLTEIDKPKPTVDSLANIQQESSYDLTSPARIILTFLENQQDHESRLNLIFDEFFGIYDPDEIVAIICDLLTKRKTWRRVVYTSYIKLEDKDETINDQLIKQTENYKLARSINYRTSDEHFAIIGITPAGEVFNDIISTYYEFYSMRINRGYLPLYDERNLRRVNDGNNSFSFQIIVESVLESVKGYINRLEEYNRRIMQVKKYTLERYLKSDFVGFTDITNVKQFHEEKLIFRHILYLDDFRNFLVKSNNLNDDEKKELNQILIKYITEYIDLFDYNEFLSTYRNNVKKNLRKSIEDITNSEFTDIDTRLRTTGE